MKNDDKIWKACIYARLSRDDGDKSESDSITNQRALIHDYAKTQPQIQICGERVDDGYSGVTFERPGFMAMMDDINSGLYNCVIVKDLSRFGRNWIESGRYIEQIFPYIGVRFIAVNDHYDSMVAKNNNDNITLPFKNLINDAYAADISRKIRSQLDVKRRNGEFIGSFAAYGYIKDPNNRNKLIVDEFAANVVMDIFKWRIAGMSNQNIAARLNEMGILSPCEYKRESGLRYSSPFKKNTKSLWSAVAVGRILANEVYIGVTEQGKRTSKSHKVKNRINKSKTDWTRVEETHEPIVSRHDFALVVELLKQDVRVAPGKDELYPFSGLLKCADCKQNMIRKLIPNGDTKYVYYVCGTNKNHKTCSPHRINETHLINAVLLSIKAHIANIVEMERVLRHIQSLPLNKHNVKKLDNQLTAKRREMEKYQSRKLKLHEDLQDGIIDRDEYIRYKAEFTKLCNAAEAAAERLSAEMDDLINNRGNTQMWLEHFIRHQNIDELTRGIAVNLVEKIYVHENNTINIVFKYQYNFDRAMNYIKSVESVKRKDDAPCPA
jgi:DNA invertase Pin-like site-specific DNA recombinase